MMGAAAGRGCGLFLFAAPSMHLQQEACATEDSIAGHLAVFFSLTPLRSGVLMAMVR
jgi:hypothetical protein